MRFTIDLETACTVESCPDVGKAICRNKHGLSPWHSRITVAALVGDDGSERVARGASSAVIVAVVKSHLDEAERKHPWTVDGHSFKFDWLHLAVHGCKIPLERWVADSSLAAYTLTEKIPDSWLAEYEVQRQCRSGFNRKAGKHSLKTLAPFFLGVEPFWESEGDGGHDSDEYVLKDTRYTSQLVPLLEQKLKDAGQFEFYQTKLLPWTKLLLRAELRGVRIDMEELAAKEVDLKKRMIILKTRLDEMWAPAHEAYYDLGVRECHARYLRMLRANQKNPAALLADSPRYAKLFDAARARVPKQISYDSPKQMAWLLRDYLGYNIESLEGKDGTGREVLERLADEGKEDVKTYLEWRRCNKILTAFLPSYRELAAPDDLETDGRVRLAGGALHPIYNPDVTRTGRTSSERPNAQQVPPQLRSLIVARPGYKFIGYDAAAIEAKLIALYSEDPTLYGIISTGVSIHDYNTVNFLELSDTGYAEVKTKHPQLRKGTKNVGFALFYNAGINRIRIAYAQAGIVLTVEQCRRIHKKFKNDYKAAYEYANDVVKRFERGEVIENLLGRPLAIENAEDAYMQGFNKLIQSSASDYLLHSAQRADEAMAAAGIEAHPVLFVHDFVCFEVEEQRADEADAIIRNAMTDYLLETQHGRIKLEVEGGIMDRWEK